MKETQFIEYEDGSKVELDADDAPELTEADFARMRPAREVLPTAFWKALEEGRVGRPKAIAPKKPVTIRLDPDVLEAWRASGANWQTRINEVLRNHAPS